MLHQLVMSPMSKAWRRGSLRLINDVCYEEGMEERRSQIGDVCLRKA